MLTKADLMKFCRPERATMILMRIPEGELRELE